MNPVRLNFITEEEKEQINKENISKGGFRDQFEPGTCSYMPWIHDPREEFDEKAIQEKIALYKQGVKPSYLSIHYWQDWAHIRPPLLITLPNQGLWVPDAGSTNGTGWSVLIENGELPSETNRNPKITASPSINHNVNPNKENWHGWLIGGLLVECGV